MSTRRALFFSFVDRYSGLLIAIGSSMAIARLLKPEELGVFSVAMALLMLANTVRDMGAGQYLVQVDEVTEERIRAVWTLQLSIGVGLGLIIAVLAIPAGTFYNEPRIPPLLGVMAVTYFVNPIGSITYALLMRDMRFQHVAVMRFSANLAGAVVSIALAANDVGPISLAWGHAATITVNALVAQFFRDRSIPWGISFRAVRDVLKFGGKITGTSIISSLQSSTPDFVLGKLQDMTAAGLFSRSNGLVSMFSRLVLDAIYGVAVSALAAQARAGQSTAPAFLRALSYISVLNWVFAINLVAFADPITRVLFGGQWEDSVPLTQLLAIASAALAPVHICNAINMAHGKASNVLRATLVTAGVSVPLILLGAALDLQALGILLIVAAMASSLYWLNLTLALLELRWSEALRVLWQSARVALGCAVLPAVQVFIQGFRPASSMLTLVIATAGGLFSLFGCLYLFRHPLHDEVASLRLRRSSE